MGACHPFNKLIHKRKGCAFMSYLCTGVYDLTEPALSLLSTSSVEAVLVLRSTTDVCLEHAKNIWYAAHAFAEMQLDEGIY